MKATRLWRLAAGALLCAALAGALPVSAIPETRLARVSSGAGMQAQAGEFIHLPVIGRNYLDPMYRSSRFGVGVPDSGATSVPLSSLNRLNAGWYLDWTARAKPSRPGGISFTQLVNLREDGTSALSGPGLAAAVGANPGALWLIGNEPDSPHQNNVNPETYARAYHDLYHQIKAVDPTALVSAGGIVQPTPLRLRYLDLILEEYTSLYGSQMPVDVWNIHIYILREEKDTWGAFYPPGISDEDGTALGILYEIQDHDNIEIFQEMVVQFRQWMADKGYRECPLIITEFGVIMPWDYLVEDPNDREAADARVLAFMDASVGYLLAAQDTSIGYPHDDNRLVQRWAWYALAGSWSGWLFEMGTAEMSVFGQRYAELAAAQPRTVNLLPTRLTTVPSAVHAGAEGVRLQATIANNGGVATSRPVAVRFYEGGSEGGVQIGETQYVASLDGGAGLAIVSVPWTPAEATTYQITVQVDPLDGIAETNEGDNTLSQSVTVMNPTDLPIVIASDR